MVVVNWWRVSCCWRKGGGFVRCVAAGAMANRPVNMF
jgi:hypothetical protein